MRSHQRHQHRRVFRPEPTKRRDAEQTVPRRTTLAVAVGFEPTAACTARHFECRTFGLSDTLPRRQKSTLHLHPNKALPVGDAPQNPPKPDQRCGDHPTYNGCDSKEEVKDT